MKLYKSVNNKLEVPLIRTVCCEMGLNLERVMAGRSERCSKTAEDKCAGKRKSD